MSEAMPEVMQQYQSRNFTAPMRNGHSVTHTVYSRGEGPVVVIIQELPGIGPEILELAEHFIGLGFSVVLPHLFGPLGRISMLGNVARVFCLRKEFHLFAKQASSPIVDWLAALCRDLRSRRNVSGVGVIGMCLTGNFAISLMADDSVLAGVASQPSLPLNDSRALHMSEEEVSEVRTALDEKGAMMSLRFAEDKICKAARFEAIDAAFNTEGEERVRLKTLPGKGHSVLTLDFVNEAGHPTRQALDEVLSYFRSALSPEPKGETRL